MTVALETKSSAVRSPGLRVLGRDQAAAGPSLLDQLLREQQRPTAVERFARLHDEGRMSPQQKRYQTLLPSERPAAGQQYAFEVNLDACTGCKACVTACHSLNGLDDGEVWRTVGLLQGGSVEAPVQQTVTTACHHCVDPACLSGCPVKAYEKDPVTGIVRHLDDQCIGCQYCTLMCPYDAPKFNARQGIVRKCDLCSDRLAVGEAPACVQGCPNEAIRIRVVDQVQALHDSEAGRFLPGAPTPEHTVPTTRYLTARNDGPVSPADLYRVSPEHAHHPLVVMLVFTQLSVGAFVVEALCRALFGAGAAAGHLLSVLFPVTAALLALGASTLHLGRPRFAFRAVLGLRTSWLSREAVAFGVFAKLALLTAIGGLGPHLEGLPGMAFLQALEPLWRAAAIAFGLGGVLCSVMVYVATRRAHWSAGVTGFKFLGSLVLLGAASVYLMETLAVGALDPTMPTSVQTFSLWMIIAMTSAKLVYEGALLRHVRDAQHSVLKRMALLMVRDLRGLTLARFALGAAGGLVLPALLMEAARPVCTRVGLVAAAIGVLLLVAGGELLERALFFKAAPASRMPGGLS